MIQIGGVLRFSLLDYPGKISAVLFTQGCPLKCIYCHNPELQRIKLRTKINFKAVLDFLETRVGLLEGVVFSGGEPLLQVHLYDAMRLVKSMGYSIGLHTSGCIYEHFIRVLPIVDWVGFDIKQIFNKYSSVTQINNLEFQVFKSFKALVNSNIEYELRTTVDTRYISYEDLLNIAKFLTKNKVKEWTLQKCIIRDNNNTIKIPFLNKEQISGLEEYVAIKIR